MFVLLFFIISAINSTKKILINTILFVSNIVLLIYIQYNYPELVLAYPNHDAQFSDLSIGLIVTIIIFAFLVSIFIKSYEAERQKVELQKIELQKAYLEIATKNKNITDSIAYAKRIQTAVLPKQNQIDNLFSENFILFKPRDVVSGDFYFMK